MIAVCALRSALHALTRLTPTPSLGGKSCDSPCLAEGKPRPVATRAGESRGSDPGRVPPPSRPARPPGCVGQAGRPGGRVPHKLRKLWNS